MNSLRRRASTPSRFGLFDRFFSYMHNRSPFDRILLGFFLIIFVVAGIAWLWFFSAENQTNVPTSGGVLKEGIIGTPRFVNPVLAITRADQDMAHILYRGLYTVDETGALVFDLAESVDISDNNQVYRITLKEDQKWHDGVAITANDVAYTIGLVQNPELKSPVRGNWNDVTVEVVNDRELHIVLEDTYVPFIENLTLGILPRHLWEHATADELPFSRYNTEPVGSGPYQIKEVVRSQSGLIEQYILTRFESYEPASQMAGLEMHFFADESTLLAALEDGTITHTAALEDATIAALGDTYTVYTRPLPRVFALYPNQNRSAAIRDEAARVALSEAIDRTALIGAVLSGYGNALTGPIPNGFSEGTTTEASSSDPVTTLLAGGWIQNDAGQWTKEIDEEETTLAVTITTANTPLFEATAEYIRTVWEELGVTVNIAYYEQADLVQAIIRPRDYELLLFGTEVGRALDYYPFWHSSQREDPGLNIAQYTSITADNYLEEYRTTADAEARAQLLRDFTTELTSETPAIFLFNPLFTYVTTNDTDIAIPQRLNRPSERFATIASWHIESESLWPIFINETE